MAIKINEAAETLLLRSEEGPVGQYIRRRAEGVETRASDLASGGLVQIQTGRLHDSIAVRMELREGEICAIVGSDATSDFRGVAFSYPAYLDQVGSKSGEPRPWLTLALAEEFT